MGKTTKTYAAEIGAYFVMEPAISREEASEYIRAPIPLEAWEKIQLAFSVYGHSLERLSASRTSKSKDKQKASWRQRKEDTAKALDAALGRLKAARSHGDFLFEASNNYSLAKFGHNALGDNNAARLINEAFQLILRASVIVDRAEAQSIELPTEATARDILIRSIRDALVESSILVNASHGTDVSEEIELADFTPFEQMLFRLGVGNELLFTSFATTVRAALSAEE